MGCGLTQPHVQPHLDFTLQMTGFPHFDEVFLELERPLTVVNQCSSDLRKTLKHFYKETGVSPQLREPEVLDGFVAMLLVYATAGNGSLEAVGFRVLTVPPYIDVDGSGLGEEQRCIPGLWNDLVRISTSVAGQLAPLLPLVKTAAASNASTLYSDAPNQVKSAILDNHLSPPQATRLIRIVLDNHAKICQAPALLEDAIDSSEVITKFISRISDEVQNMKGLIEQIGGEASRKKICSGVELVANYWATIEEKKRVNEMVKVGRQRTRRQ